MLLYHQAHRHLKLQWESLLSRNCNRRGRSLKSHYLKKQTNKKDTQLLGDKKVGATCST